MKRCAIYLFYDRDGIVDEYNIVLLKEVKKHAEFILAVCNGPVKESGKEKLESVASEVLVRENTGMDVGGYKAGIAHIGFEKLSEYDEIILMNYTFFGPLYPFSEMFGAMEKKNIDFWGITSHEKVDPDPFGCISYGYLPRHIQSYFLVLRHRLFISDDFQAYWKELQIPVKYTDSIVNFETVFTKIFEDKGYKWDTYIQNGDMKEKTVCPVMYYAKELIEQKRCPIVKRRVFYHDYIDLFTNTCGESYQLAYQYIRDHLDYDMDLIWDNLLRLENMANINRALHLNYFLSSKSARTFENTSKTAAVFYFNDERLVPYYLQYVKSMPQGSKLYFICSDDRIKDKIETFHVAYGQYEYQIACSPSMKTWDEAMRNIPERWLDSTDLVCVVNASGTELGIIWSNISSWREKNLESTLASEAFVQNVIQVFQSEPRLGLLSPFKPIHGVFYERLERVWKEKAGDVEGLLRILGCENANLSADEIPIAPFAGSFWVRTPILRRLCSGELQEASIAPEGNLSISVIACLMPFLAQYAGFYSGWLFCNEYSVVDFTNMDHMVRETNKVIFRRWCPGIIQDLVTIIEKDKGNGGGPVPITWKRKVKNRLKKILPAPCYQLGKTAWHKIKEIKR